jgi:hypothetical protein
VVGADGGGIHVAHAVGQHGDARAFLAADDRAAYARAEEGALHAGQFGHGVTQGAGLLFVQAFTSQDVDRAGERFGVALQGGGGDLDRGQFGEMTVAMAGIVIGGVSQRGNEDHGKGQGQGVRREQGAGRAHGQ